MSFLAPWMLGLLALGGLIWLLHARQRSELDVSSLLVWQRALARQARAVTATWRPRLNLLIALQLLALFAMVVALSQPLFGANRDVDHWIYVLDNSASMQRSDGASSAARTARGLLAERLAQANSGARVSLLMAGLEARPIFARQPATAENLSDRLSDLSLEDGVADWDGAARLVAALRTHGEITRVVALSDAPVPTELIPAGNEGITLETVILGSSGGNAGLSATLARDERTGQWVVEGRVRFSGGLSQTTLAIDYVPDGGEPMLLAEQMIVPTISDADSGAFALSFPAPGDGIVIVHLADDAAAFDNRIFFVISDRPHTTKILYIGTGERPLLAALSAVAGVEITEAPGEVDEMDGYDLVVADGVALSRRPRTNTLWVGAAAIDDAPVPRTGAPFEPTGWRTNHLLSSNIAWQALTIGTAFDIPARADAERLVSDQDAPLLDLVETASGFDIRLAFDPAASNWPEQGGFVVFASQLVDWISPASGSFVGPICVVGQPCRIEPQLAGGRLTRLDSADEKAKPIPAQFLPYRAGLFEIVKDNRRLTLPIHPPALSDFPPASKDEGTANLPETPIVLWPWLVLTAAVLLVAEAALARRRRDRPQGLLRVFGLRAVVLTFALFAIADVRIPVPADGTALLVVAAEPDANIPTRAATLILAGPAADADGTDTVRSIQGSLADGVRLAASLAPADTPTRILLADTALDNDGAFALGTELAGAGLLADVWAEEAPAPTDLWIEGLDIPPRTYVGDSFMLQARIGAIDSTSADVTATLNGLPIYTETRDLLPGLNRLAIPVENIAAGESLFEVTVKSSADPEPRNDRDGAVLDVAGTGRVAVLSGEPARGDQFAAMLSAQGLAAEAIAPETAPVEAGDWRDYDALVLMNLPAAALSTAQQRAIETAVRGDELGLMILGGANSFGPGGYLETPLDSVSPISSRVPRDKPGVALVFVLDRSSSMGQAVGPLTRLHIAKQATLAAVSLLDEDSSVSVIAFDSRARLALPLTSVAQTDFIARSVNQISLGGGTAMQRGLSTGLDQIRRADAAARHIILMTDGLSQPFNYSVLLDALNTNGITLSTVAIGEEADRVMVEELAERGGGIFHATDDFEALPSILSQEAMRLAGDPIETEPAQPYWIEQDLPFLLHMPETLPEIEGFVLTTAKPEARTLAMVDDSTGQPVPFMAYWQYGLGHVLAMTTDAAGGWTRGWQNEDTYPRLFSQALRSFLPSSPGDPRRAAITHDNDRIAVSLSGVADRPDLILTESSILPRPLQVSSAGEGMFNTAFRPSAAGPYRIASPDGTWNFAGYAGYPQRLNWSQRDDAGALVATLTGGEVIARGEIPASAPAGPWTAKSVWPLWVSGALLLFLADLIIRYIRQQRPSRSKPPRSGAQNAR